jgi:hypothetical protein
VWRQGGKVYFYDLVIILVWILGDLVIGTKVLGDVVSCMGYIRATC